MLNPQQWELEQFRFGLGTAIEVADFEIGAPDIETGDVLMPGGDGLTFGRDFHHGRTLTWELFTARQWTATAARSQWAELATRWQARRLRSTPRRVVPLRMRIPGGETVRVYGRPRRFEPVDAGQIRAGHVEMLADFRCADSLFYGDVERSLSLDLVASGGDGITWPVTWPVTWGSPGARQDVVRNVGTESTWPVITVHGPVAQPVIGYVGTTVQVRLDVTLAHDRSITLDTRPWERTVLRDDGASFAGDLRGSRLADLALPPGQTTVRFSGTDLTGQARTTVRWRDARTTP